MNAHLQQFLVPHKEALKAICQQYHVDKLHVSGSVTTHTFQPEHSDIDLIVRFENLLWHPEDKGQLYWDLLDAFENLFGRKVDLLVDKKFTNPDFRQAVEDTKLLIYDRAQSKEVLV